MTVGKEVLILLSGAPRSDEPHWQFQQKDTIQTPDLEKEMTGRVILSGLNASPGVRTVLGKNSDAEPGDEDRRKQAIETRIVEETPQVDEHRI